MMHSAPLLALALQRQAQAMARLPFDTHGSWLTALGLPPPGGDSGPTTAWAASLEVESAPFDVLDHGACQLAWLPPALAARALRLRALMHRRRALRVARAAAPAAIDARGADWLGATGWQALLHDAPAALNDAPLPAGDIAGLAPTLAWEGYCRLQAESAWPASGPARLLRLRFPRSLAPVPCGPAEPALTHWLLARVPDLFHTTAEDAP